MKTVKGSCLCGAVRFTATNPRQVIACHCTQCRKQSGHFWAASWSKDVTVTGSENLTWFDASSKARRGFCKTCGASLFWDAHAEDGLSFAAGALDDAGDIQLTKHIFVADKGDYYEPDPAIPTR